MEINSVDQQNPVKKTRGRKKAAETQQVEIAPKIEETESILAELPKTKRVPNEKTLNALKAGREKLSQRWDEQRKQREEYAEKIAIKKANQVIRAKQNIKKQLGAEDLSSDEEHPIVQIQPVKPKKKQVVYLPPESDSEEEVIYKRAPPKQKKTLGNVQEIEPIQQMPRIRFC